MARLLQATVVIAAKTTKFFVVPEALRALVAGPPQRLHQSFSVGNFFRLQAA